MATATQLFADRDTAGAAYLAALNALADAWIDLKALDIACGNAGVLAKHPSGGALTPVRTFEALSKMGQEALRHPAYASLNLAAWEDTAKSEAEILIRNVS